MTFEEIMACVDCLMLVANGDLPEERQDLEADIQAWLGKPSGMVCAGSGDKDDEFSWRRCDCCGSMLGGSRHQLFVQEGGQ